MFKNTKVSLRLALLGGTLIGLMLIIGVLGIQGMKTANLSMRSVYEDRVIPLKQLKQIADMYAVNIVDTSHKVRNKNLDWQTGTKNVQDAEKIIHDRWNAYLATELVPEEQALVK